MAGIEYPPEHALRWTRRQRQVLDLIARGRTNAEIAETLGVSLAGAKWHVSEVISKLGVTSREEVAEYWRESNSVGARFGRGMRGLAGLLTMKTISGGIAAAAAGAVAVGAVIVAADSGSDERGLALDATATLAPLASTATPAPEGFVAEVPAPEWWVPPPDRAVPDDAPREVPCLTGWDDPVGFAYLEVPGNEYYWVVTRETYDFGDHEAACEWHSGRVGYSWDSSGNLHQNPRGGSAGGGTFTVDPDAPPSCGTSRVPRFAGGEPEVTLHLDCSVPLNVAYAIVDDGTPERVEAFALPTVLGFPRKGLVAGHRTYGPIVITFYEADGTFVYRDVHTSPDDPRPFVNIVPPPRWLTPDLRERPVADLPLCSSGWDAGVGVAHVESEGMERYLVFFPDPVSPDPDRICWRGYDRDGSIEQSSFEPNPDQSVCRYPAGGPTPHWALCNVSTDVAYAIFDDGTPVRVEAIDLPTVLGIERRIILTTHTSPNGAATVEFYDQNGVLLETFEQAPYPGSRP